MANKYIKHGMTNHPIYKTYHRILDRCNNKNNQDYHHYGGRGIKCEWKSFLEFKNDMLEAYLKGVKEGRTEIDRIDNNGNYSKKNCRFANRTEQTRNTRLTKYYNYKGSRKTIHELAEKFNIDVKVVRSRLSRNWSLEESISTPLYHNNHSSKYITYNKETLNITRWAKKINISSELLSYRIRKWGIKKALETKKNSDGRFQPILYDGYTLKYWSKQSGIKADTLWSRIHKQDMNINEAINKKI